MTTAIMSAKGQVTIPVAVRSALGIHAGDKVEFVELADGEFLLVPATRSVTSLKGLIGKPAQAVSVEEMNVAIAQHGMSAG